MARVLLGSKFQGRPSIADISFAELETAVKARRDHPTPTDHICDSLLSTLYVEYNGSQQCRYLGPLARLTTLSASSWRVKGHMTVVRVPNVKQAKILYEGIQEFLKLTADSEQPWSRLRPDKKVDWQAFDVLMDIGKNEQKDLGDKLSPFFRRSGLSISHPEVQVRHKSAQLEHRQNIMALTHPYVELAYTSSLQVFECACSAWQHTVILCPVIKWPM